MEEQAQVGVMSPEVQIKGAVEEGMANIAMAIFGENLRFYTTFNISGLSLNGLGMVHAMTSTLVASEQWYVLRADVPIRFPDAECGGYRIADEPFVVEANDWGKGFLYEAWCENNPSLGAQTIVRAIRKQYSDERWLFAGTLDCEVSYRGPFSSLFPWAKQIVAEKWSHLPHVCMDTETHVMRSYALFLQD